MTSALHILYLRTTPKPEQHLQLSLQFLRWGCCRFWDFSLWHLSIGLHEDRIDGRYGKRVNTIPKQKLEKSEISPCQYVGQKLHHQALSLQAWLGLCRHASSPGLGQVACPPSASETNSSRVSFWSAPSMFSAAVPPCRQYRELSARIIEAIMKKQIWSGVAKNGALLA